MRKETMRVTKAAIRLARYTSTEQAEALKKMLSDHLPEIDWTMIAADDIVVLETDESGRRGDNLETR